MAPIWMFIVLILIVLFAFFLTPPTAWINKVVGRFRIHPIMNPASVKEVVVNEVRLTPKERLQFIRDFNEANFLFEGGMDQKFSTGHAISVVVEEQKVDYQFTMYTSGSEIEVVREVGRKSRPYRIKSRQFVEHLLAFEDNALNQREN